MANVHQNDDNLIGKRIGRLLQQFRLRHAYAEHRSGLMRAEYERASGSGQTERALKAKIGKAMWDVYAKNVGDLMGKLGEDVRNALVCYNQTERGIWWAYFVEGKSSYDIGEELHVNSRTVQRAVAAMRRDMEMSFSFAGPKVEGEAKTPKWGAQDLADYMRPKASPEYVSAVNDMLERGIVDCDALDFDPAFQEAIRKESDET